MKCKWIVHSDTKFGELKSLEQTRDIVCKSKLCYVIVLLLLLFLLVVIVVVFCVFPLFLLFVFPGSFFIVYGI